MSDELQSVLMKKCERLETNFCIDDTEIFFGMYANCVKDFKYQRGDRLLITEIAEHLEKQCNSIGLMEFAKSFEMPRGYKVKKKTSIFPFGVFLKKTNEVASINRMHSFVRKI